MLVRGAPFLKYGRNGPKPKQKFVCVANKPRRLIWATTPEYAYMCREGCAHARHRPAAPCPAASVNRLWRVCVPAARRVGDKGNASEVSLEHVVAVRIGKHTKVFERKVAVRAAAHERPPASVDNLARPSACLRVRPANTHSFAAFLHKRTRPTLRHLAALLMCAPCLCSDRAARAVRVLSVDHNPGPHRGPPGRLACAHNAVGKGAHTRRRRPFACVHAFLQTCRHVCLLSVWSVCMSRRLSLSDTPRLSTCLFACLSVLYGRLSVRGLLASHAASLPPSRRLCSFGWGSSRARPCTEQHGSSSTTSSPRPRQAQPAGPISCGVCGV